MAENCDRRLIEIGEPLGAFHPCEGLSLPDTLKIFDADGIIPKAILFDKNFNVKGYYE